MRWPPIFRTSLRRYQACLLIAILLGSVRAHSGFGWAFSHEGGGREFPLFWAGVQDVILVLGAGGHALRLPLLESRLGRFA